MRRDDSASRSLLGCMLCAAAVGTAAAMAPPSRDDARPAPETSRHVAITARDAPTLAAALVDEGYDVLEGSVTPDSFELMTTPLELTRLEARGLEPRLLSVCRPFREIQAERLAGRRGAAGTVPVGYPELDSVIAQMSAAAAAFPAICQFVDLTATLQTPPTFDGRNLHAVKISDNVEDDEDEPAFLLVSAHHSREIVTPVIALHAIEQLTSLYGIDSEVTALVDEYEIWIAPLWNPDGYVHVFNMDNGWRKNRHVFDTGVGVELNRNYPFGWASACAGSTAPSSGGYKGPSPASESETQTMLALSEDRHFAKVLDFHSSGSEVLWGYHCLIEPFGLFLQEQAIELSNAFGFDADIRPPSAEGEHYEWQFAVRGAQSNLVEISTPHQPPFPDAQQEAVALFPGILYALQRPIPLWGRVTDALSGQPIVATISYPELDFQNGETNTSSASFGRYHAFPPDGEIVVQFSAPGYLEQSYLLDIAADAPLVLDVALTPAAVLIEVLDAPSGVIEPGTSPSVTVSILPNLEGLDPASPTVRHRYDDGPFLATPLTPSGTDLYTATLPPAWCGDDPEFYFSAAGDLGTGVTLPANAPVQVLAFVVGQPFDLITAGDSWRYMKGTAEPTPNDLSAWSALGFDDSGWMTGPSGFGYGTDCAPFGTQLDDMQDGYSSLYTRTTFTIPTPSAVVELILVVDYDDSFVAYINGLEVARRNVAGTPPPFDQLADVNHECSGAPDAESPLIVPIHQGTDLMTLLVPGHNVLAIQAHNLTLDSSDFTMLASLSEAVACLPSAAPPTVAAVGSRYLMVTPATGQPSVALRVESPALACAPRFVDASGFLADEPTFLSSAEWGTVVVGDLEIVPDTVYQVRADVREEAEPENLSPAVQATTWVWGDGDGDDDVNITDIVCVLDGFRDVFNVCGFYGTDLVGSIDLLIPDRSIDISDIVAVLDAFRSLPYPGQSPCSPEPTLARPRPRAVVLDIVPAMSGIVPGQRVAVEVYASHFVDLRAAQIALDTRGGRGARLDVRSIFVARDRDDYLFAGLTDFVALDESTQRIGLAALQGRVTHRRPRAYLGTFIFQAASSAQGRFAVGLRRDDTRLLDSTGQELPAYLTREAHIEVRLP